MTRASAVAGLLLFTLLAACSSGNSEPGRKNEVKTAAQRKQAPNWTLKDSDGRAVSLADYKGKVVLLNFWATWCGPCKIEIPWFIEFEQKYKDRGFAVLGVAMDDEGWEVVKPYIVKNKVNYRTVMGTDMVAQQYGGVESLPTTFVIDKDGRIASTHIGLISKGDYENEIVQLLDSRADAGRDSGVSTHARR
ncbi:MAG TPA: TlpA disulfide reductase family protein [Bryobacteraceae bacterium]|nr:TlpA disulfide reductase family protein [Bryobacteraceae bacterium]